MIKRVSVYATGIAVKDGPICHFRPGEGYSYMKANTLGKEYVFTIDAATLVPKESFNFMVSSNVYISTLTLDEEGTFYDLGESILTDKFMSAKVRQFLTGPIINLNKKPTTKGFVLLDLEF